MNNELLKEIVKQCKECTGDCNPMPDFSKEILVFAIQDLSMMLIELDKQWEKTVRDEMGAHSYAGMDYWISRIRKRIPAAQI